MRWWDESMFAVNSYEMIQNGKWYSLYFDGHPDLYNTKPPLTSWLQVFFIKIIGYNELAIRLPSALAACGSVLMVFRFLQKRWGYIWAWSSGLILMTSLGFVHFHTARTGDSDSLLTFFLLGANLSFISFLQSENKRSVLLFFLFLMLAFLTKLHAALLFAPAYLILLILGKQFKAFVFNLQFLTGVITFMGVIGFLMWLREQDVNGYIHEVFFKDVGRVTKEVEGHARIWRHYLDEMISWRYAVWWVLTVIGLVLSLTADNPRKKVLTACAIMVLTYLLIISISVTKLVWYDMPLYPLMSILGGYSLYYLIDQMSLKSEVLKYGLLGLVGLYPVISIFHKTQRNEIESSLKEMEANSLYIHQKIMKGEETKLKGVTVLYSDWNGSILFYQYRLAEENIKIDLSTDTDSLHSGMTILLSNDSLKTVILNNYKVVRLDSVINAALWKLKEN